MLAFCKAAVEQRVAVVPGTAFLTDDKGTSESVRLNFSTPTDEQIVEGINPVSYTHLDVYKRQDIISRCAIADG